MFGVRGAESFQSEYQRLVEVWLRKFTEIEEKIERDKSEQKGKIEVRDKDDKLLYSEVNGKTICTLTSEQMQKLDEASNLSPPKVVEGLPSLKVKVDGEIFFQSENEKVVVNERVAQAETELPKLEGDVKVFFSENGESELIYGQVGKNLINKLTSDQVGYFRDATNLAVGSRVDELAGLKVKAGDEVLFQADESGKVLVNDAKLQQAVEQIQQPPESVGRQVQSEEIDYYDDYDYFDEQSYQDNSSQEPVSEIEAEIEPEEVQQQPEQEEENDALTDALVEMMVPIIEAMPAVVEEPAQSLQKEEDLFFEQSETLTQKSEPVQKKEKLSTRVGIPTQDTSVLLPQKSGLDAVQEALGEMKEGRLKSLLQGVTTDMQATAAQQPPNPAMDTLLSERSQDKSNTQWWQQLGNKLDSMVTTVRENFTQHRAASTLKDLANRLALQPGDSYEGADYNLSRQGKDYTLTDKQGNELIKFQSSPLGVKVDMSLPVLDDSHFRKTEQLRLSFKEGKTPSGSFMSQGAAEAKNIKRINTITQALSQYAAALGGKAKVEGKFNYSFEANSSGSAIIRDKFGKALLAVGQGHMRSRMSEKDLQHFEQMLPALQGMQQMQQQPVAAAVQGKQMEM